MRFVTFVFRFCFVRFVLTTEPSALVTPSDQVRVLGEHSIFSRKARTCRGRNANREKDMCGQVEEGMPTGKKMCVVEARKQH